MGNCTICTESEVDSIDRPSFVLQTDCTISLKESLDKLFGEKDRVSIRHKRAALCGFGEILTITVGNLSLKWTYAKK